MPTAVTYLRVSSLDQVQNTSLNDQDERTKKHIADNGWTFLRAFREEGVSAKTDDRPQLKALYQFCAENDVDYVVAIDMSRISRDTESYLRIRRTLGAVGTKLSFISFDPGDTPEGEFIATVTAAASQLENRLRGQKAKRGMLATMKAGGWVAHAPLGYRCVRVGRIPSLEPTEDAWRIRNAFEDVASGEKTIYEAAKDIGISKPEPFFVRAVFAGFNEIDGELYKGTWTPIVPLATWYRVRERMKHKCHHKQTDFWLRGFLKCECGKMLTASYSKGKTKRYGYYHCAYCKARHSAPKLEARFREWMDRLAFEHSATFSQLKRDSVAKIQDLVEASVKAKNRAASEDIFIAKRLSKLVDLKLDGGITDREYAEKRAELVARRKELQHELALGAMDSDTYFVLLEDAAHVLSHFTEFLGKAGYEDLMVLSRTLLGSTITVGVDETLSNTEKDGLYWLESALTNEKESLATLMGSTSNSLSVQTVRIIHARLKIARTILDNVMGEKQ